jgi:hypothetical protein
MPEPVPIAQPRELIHQNRMMRRPHTRAPRCASPPASKPRSNGSAPSRVRASRCNVHPRPPSSLYAPAAYAPAARSPLHERHHAGAVNTFFRAKKSRTKPSPYRGLPLLSRNASPALRMRHNSPTCQSGSSVWLVPVSFWPNSVQRARIVILYAHTPCILGKLWSTVGDQYARQGLRDRRVHHRGLVFRRS